MIKTVLFDLDGTLLPMDQDDFEWITTYENSSYCKPNPAYYFEIMRKLDADRRNVNEDVLC